MSTEENKDIARRWVDEVWGKQDLSAIEDLFAPDYAVNGQPLGVEGVRRSVISLRSIFGDPTVEIEDLIAERDKVVMRWTMRGTHQGAFMGVPPTGKRVTLTGINIYRVAGGKIVENHESVDLLGLLEQLGAGPGGPRDS